MLACRLAPVLLKSSALQIIQQIHRFIAEKSAAKSMGYKKLPKIPVILILP
jgi:hypothetical protein